MATDLKPHQVRVVNERDDLSGRLSRLRSFMASDTWAKLDADERARLRQQESVMTQYERILNERIGAFAHG